MTLPDDQQCALEFLETVPKAMRLIKTEMRSAAKPQLTVPRYRVFARLARSSANSGELAEWMGVTAPTMSRMVDALIKKKLIKRAPKTKDRRQIPLELTTQGRKQYDALRFLVRNKIADRISSLKPADKEVVRAGLIILREIAR